MPVVDGVISAGEYGVHTNGQNQQTSGRQLWYMTWDNTNLYAAIMNADITQGGVLYLDKNPLVPNNGGTNTDGTIVGQNYDGTNFAALQFRADLVVYFKDSYREFRTADIPNFGPTNVRHFTMNTSGRTITRQAGSGGAWTITGDLLVEQGTISRGTSTTLVTVSRDVTVGSGGTVTLSTAVGGGDLTLLRHLAVNGIFTANGRSLTMNGTGAQTFTSNRSGNPVEGRRG